MKKIELTQASKPLSEYAQELDEPILVVNSKHEPVAALVSFKNVDSESLSLSVNSEFLDIINAARNEIHSGNTLSLEEMKQSKID